jgi:hypothetical protein
MASSGQVNLIAFGAIGTGIILGWSGLTNAGILKTVQSLIQGKKPAAGPSQTIAPPITSGNTTTAGGVTVTNPGPGEDAWFTSLCLAVAAPPTKSNISSLESWASKESPWNAEPPDGAEYTHNPLNTTLATSGATGSVNSAGVKVYGTAAEGIAATAATLLGGYPAIVSLLRSGDGLCGSTASGEFSKWSDGGYSEVC